MKEYRYHAGTLQFKWLDFCPVCGEPLNLDKNGQAVCQNCGYLAMAVDHNENGSEGLEIGDLSFLEQEQYEQEQDEQEQNGQDNPGKNYPEGFQSVESRLDSELNLDPLKCRHRMATWNDLFEEGVGESIYETLCPTKAGPWLDKLEWMEESVGYEGMTDTESQLPPQWEVEAESFISWNREMEGLARAVDLAISAEVRRERSERFSSILHWVLWVATPALLRAHKGRFWALVKKNRAQCEKWGLWYLVYLSKAQVDAINEAFSVRLDAERERLRLERESKL